MAEPIRKQRTFRLVCSQAEIPSVDRLLEAEGFRTQALACSRFGRAVTTEPRALGSSLAGRFGRLYILDKSSFLPPLCLEPCPGDLVLDMCASPGGKTGLLAQLVGRQGLVVANESHPRRYQTLRRNLELMDCWNVVTTRRSGQELPAPEAGFARILLDAPCSGWGTVDRHPRVTEIWRPDRLGPLLELQRQLLSRAAALLRPGGRLVYSTCTTNQEENEAQVLWACSQLGLEMVPLPEAPGFVLQPPAVPDARGCLRVNGPASGGQSFFVAGLTRPGPEGQTAEEPPGASPASLPAVEFLDPGSGLVQPDDLPAGEFETRQGWVRFCPSLARNHLPQDLAWQGLPVAKSQGGRSRISARARSLLPRSPDRAGLNLEEVADLRRLLSGQRFAAPVQGKQIGLYWQGLRLGWLQVRQDRCLWSA